jgi:hypothetical protein
MVIDNNAGSMEIMIGTQVKEVKARIDNNAGNVHLKVPADFALKFKIGGNLSSNNLDKFGLSFFDGVAESHDYEKNKKRVTVELTQNVANFSLEWKKVVDVSATVANNGNAADDDDDDDM